MKYYIQATNNQTFITKFLSPSFYKKKFYNYYESDRISDARSFNSIKAAEKYIKYIQDSWFGDSYKNFKVVTGLGEEVQSIDQEICSLLGELMKRKLRFGQILENIKFEQGDMFYKRNDELRDSLKSMLEKTNVKVCNRGG